MFIVHMLGTHITSLADCNVLNTNNIEQVDYKHCQSPLRIKRPLHGLSEMENAHDSDGMPAMNT